MSVSCVTPDKTRPAASKSFMARFASWQSLPGRSCDRVPASSRLTDGTVNNEEGMVAVRVAIPNVMLWTDDDPKSDPCTPLVPTTATSSASRTCDRNDITPFSDATDVDSASPVFFLRTGRAIPAPTGTSADGPRTTDPVCGSLALSDRNPYF